MIEHQFSAKDVNILKTETVYQGFFKVNKFHIKFKLFGGGESDTIVREVMIRQDAVAVLPYDPVTDQVVLIEQFRAGALDHHHSPWLLEMVAGLQDRDEALNVLAMRELKEESGLDLLAIHPIYDYLPSPGGTSERLHLYCGKVVAGNDGQIFGVADEHEDIKVHVLSVEEAFMLVRENKLNNAASIIALQWLMLEKENIRALWGS